MKYSVLVPIIFFCLLFTDCKKENHQPLITLIGNNQVMIECNESYVDMGATAYDDEDGDITSRIIVINEVDTSEVGIYHVFYNVTDTEGHSAVQAVREVTVVEKGFLSPSISFVPDIGYISETTILQSGEPYKIKYTAAANAITGSKLKHLKVLHRGVNFTEIVLDQIMDLDTYTGELSDSASIISGTEYWTFYVTDNNGREAMISLYITVKGGELKTYTNRTLGALYNTNYGSFFASANGNVYSLIPAYSNAAIIDWCYYNTVNDGATIAAPNDPTAISIFNSPIHGLSKWTIRNATLFNLVIAPIIWDNITDATHITPYTNNAIQSSINQLSVGSIIAFKTASGKVGMIMVQNITPGNAGTITFDVKVQK